MTNFIRFFREIIFSTILILTIQAGLTTKVAAQNNVALVTTSIYATPGEYTYIVDETNVNICSNTGSWRIDTHQNENVFGTITSFPESNDRRCKISWINNDVSPQVVTVSYTGFAYDQYGRCSVYLSGSLDITIETCQSLMKPYDTPKTICEGDVLTSVYTGPGYTYEWSNAPFSPIPGATNSSYTPTEPGYYTLKTTNSNGCAASRTMQVLLTTPPTASISTANATTICKGGSVLLQANTSPGLSYQWQNNNVAISGATGATYPAIITGNFNVSVSNSGCNRFSSSIAVVTKPVAVVPVITASGPTGFCIGSSVNLSIPNQGTEFTYQWYKDNTQISVNGNGLAYTAIESGSYTAKVESKSGCGFQISTPVLVTVTNTPPDAIITTTHADPITVCTGQTVLLSGNTGTGYLYQWYNGSSIISGATSSSYTTSTTGTYSFKVTAPTGCSKTALGKTVKVQKPLPSTVGYTNSNSTIGACGGFTQTTNLNVADYGNITFQWYKNSQPITGATGSSLAISELGTNTYYYTVTGNSNCGGPNSLSATPFSGTVTIKPPLPNTGLINQVNPVDHPFLSICKTESMTLSLTNDPPSGFDLKWYRRDLTYPNSTAIVSQDRTYNVTADGLYYAVFSNNYCNSLSPYRYEYNPSYAVEIVEVAIPVASITSSGPLSFCKGGNVGLNANTGRYLKYQWNLNGVAISGATAASYAATQSGSYTVTVNNGYSITTGACSIPAVSNAIVVNVKEPVAVITPPTTATTFCSGGSIVLKANSPVAPEVFTYQWYNNTLITGATQANYTATTSGRYSVKITDKNGCSNQSVAVPITVNANIPATVTIAPPVPLSAICTGKTALLSTASSGVGYTYQWYTTGNAPIAGATTSRYFITTGGNYYLVINSTNCGSAKTSNTLAIAENPLPDVTISVTGNAAYTNDIANDRVIELCSGQLELKVPYVQGNTYTWSGGSAGSNNSFTVTQTGNYAVTVTDQKGCSASSFPNGKTASIVINKPSIVSNSYLVYCTAFTTQPKLLVPGNVISGTTFQWFKDGTAISGAVGKEYVTASPAQGNYSVTLTNNRCGAVTSDLAHVKKANNTGDFVVSCNPTLMPGTSTRVDFTGCGLKFNAGTIFYAQLSDARGSFACPISTAQFTLAVTTTSQSPTYLYKISLPIPATAISSNKYRIRVYSSAPPTSANTGSLLPIQIAENGFDISVLDNQGNKYVDPQYPSEFIRTWTNMGSGKLDDITINTTTKFYFGNFDGDAGEEMLCVGIYNNTDYAHVVKYIDGNWKRFPENIAASIGNYVKNGDLIIGDFDGNGIDEILATISSSGENVLLKFQGTTWAVTWRDNASHGMRQYRGKKYVGDFDGDLTKHKDEVLGCDYAGWTTMFEWNGSDFIWSYWSDYGNATLNPFKNDRDKLRVGDYDGDGKADILTLGSTAKLHRIDYEPARNRYEWKTIWTNSSNNISGWNYPLAANDAAITGNIDNDNNSEMLLYNTTNTMLRVMQFDVLTTDGWTNSYQTNAFISDWKTGNSKYLFVKPVANDPAYLLAMKVSCNNLYEIAMYKGNNVSGWDYRSTNSPDQPIIEGEPILKSVVIYPNPSGDIFNVVLNNAKIKSVVIFNSVGEMVWSKSDLIESSCSVDASQWDSGIYLVRVVSEDNEEFYSKVVITR